MKFTTAVKESTNEVGKDLWEFLKEIPIWLLFLTPPICVIAWPVLVFDFGSPIGFFMMLLMVIPSAFVGMWWTRILGKIGY